MHYLVIISAWIWGHILGKFIIWPRRLEGFKWLPILYASNWYRITHMEGKCTYLYLPHMYVYENIMVLFSFIFLPVDYLIFSTLLISHTLNNIWWPAFIEIKYTFKYCFILTVVKIIFCMFSIAWTIYCYRYPIFIIFNIASLCTYIWHTWITSYAYFIIKTPTTFIEYQERQTRQVQEV